MIPVKAGDWRQCTIIGARISPCCDPFLLENYYMYQIMKYMSDNFHVLYRASLGFPPFFAVLSIDGLVST